MAELADHLRAPLADLLLAVADDKLMLGHRNSDWTGLGPILEEDIAFSSIAQDEIAHAQALYEVAGGLLGRSADQLAFGRAPAAYRCATIVEVPDDFDWAVALARRLFCDHFDLGRLERLARSSAPDLAALAKRLRAEEQVHVDHVDGWITRLGRGNDDARGRLQAALDRLAPLAPELLEPVADQDELERAGVYPAPADGDAFAAWARPVETVVAAAGLTVTLAPLAEGFVGGRRGRHTTDLDALVDEMSEVFRIEPEAAW
jgi:ring-1,2-phenylacetyl-CoA epoxidase subunit PaaC